MASAVRVPLEIPNEPVRRSKHNFFTNGGLYHPPSAEVKRFLCLSCLNQNPNRFLRRTPWYASRTQGANLGLFDSRSPHFRRFPTLSRLLRRSQIQLSAPLSHMQTDCSLFHLAFYFCISRGVRVKSRRVLKLESGSERAASFLLDTNPKVRINR